MTRKLKSIDDHNRQVWDSFVTENGAGVECPFCEDGTEMVYADSVVLTSLPPQRNVMCPVCKHTDRIFVNG